MSVFKPFLILAAVSLCSINALAQESAQDEQESDIEVIDIIKRDTTTESALDNRMEGDKEAIDNVFAITQHRQNYLLPMSYITNPNSNGNEELTEENVDKKEAKFQVSVKLPLYLEDTGFDGIYLGFTLTSFWQLYNSEVSKPFRETNYKVMALLRNNLNLGNNRGSIQLDLTYPLTDRYELLFQYFNGYGDSLIDYNRSQERVGLGFQLLFL